MYTRAQKQSSSWSPISTQKKSNSTYNSRSFSVQRQPDINPSQEKEIPSYSRNAADSLIANVMRPMEAREEEAEGNKSQEEQEAVSATEVVMPKPELPIAPAATVSQLSGEMGIQRQCSECQQEQLEQGMEEGKDSDEKSLRVGVQIKLTVGAVGDKYEQEADRVAAQVMSMSAAPDNSPQVQRFGEEDNPVQRWSVAQSITPVLQRQVDEQVQMRELVQRAFQAGGNEASGDLESRLNASKGGGSTLAPEVRSFMEPRFGADFSSVRVHTGSEAVQMNRELGAQAFAHGSDVYFGAGKSPGNNELTAHELTHVVQQSNTVLNIEQSNDGLIRAKTAKTADKQENQESQGAVKLQTALDSKVTVTKGEGDHYNIILSLDATDESFIVASYEIFACGSSLKYLPVYVEDVVTDSVALVRIQFNPDLASVNVLVSDEMHGNQRVRVEAIPTPANQLQVASAPKARDVGSGYVAEGREKVTEHAGGSELDKVLGSVASAEGGFASTEGSDQGIFTWGQGQWTVGANRLQPVMQFIKDRRPDLFDRYWGETGLDVRGSVFYYQGKPYAGKKKLRELFRGSKEQNLHWVNVFAQAGQDPLIQRLQREYQRGEVRDQLEKQIGGKSPDTWLDTRGKAFYYSMWVNLPGVAHKYFKQACQKAGKVIAPTDAIKQAISTKLEDLFNNSDVTARSGKHHYIAFWGEAGRKKAIAEADKHIADPSLDKTWTKEKWQKQKINMEKRESRYQKTKGDIDKALSRQDVEPDVPAALGSYFQ